MATGTLLSLLRDGNKYQPMPRYFHATARVGNTVLVHGGVTKDYSKKTKQRLASVVEVFDSNTELWLQKEVSGDTPAAGIFGAASAAVKGDLFTFGGHDGSKFYNSLHRLENVSQWLQLCPQNEEAESPMAKSDAGMVRIGDNLLLFGGFGIPHGPTQPGATFTKAPGQSDGSGWTNELHIFNIHNGEWTAPQTTGERPPPCSHFSLTAIDSRRAVLFGGSNGEHGLNNDVFIIDLRIMHWTKLNKPKDGFWPEKRVDHAACCLNYIKQHPQLLVVGGENEEGKILQDICLMDIDAKKWRKVSSTLKPCWGHSVTAFTLAPGLTEVTMFGGSADEWKGSADKQPTLADTKVLQFGSSDQSKWDLLSVATFPELASKEQMSQKNKLREERERLAEEMETKAKELQIILDEIAATPAERRVQEERDRAMQDRERAAQERKRATQAEKRMQEETERAILAKKQAEEERVRATKAEKRVEQEKEIAKTERKRSILLEKQIEKEQQRATQAERILFEEKEQVRQSAARAEELQRKLVEVEARERAMLVVQQQSIAAEQRGLPWEINGEDIELTENVMGIGGWAEVRVAQLKVAAKTLHRQLAYDYHQQLFRREMAVAARVSHPNLLRFYGAKMEGGMTILSELMPTSLRDKLELGHRHPKQRVPKKHLLSIAVDVASALNYLHHFFPDPLIHRDLSSANVLLKPTSNGGWLAKVSDYGSANFQQQLQTQNPGSPVYSAPESHDPSLQSPKMDIYSFGVLLIEMFTFEFPASDQRSRLITLIRFPHLVKLIEQCLDEDRHLRPTAAQVVDILQALQ